MRVCREDQDTFKYGTCLVRYEALLPLKGTTFRNNPQNSKNETSLDKEGEDIEQNKQESDAIIKPYDPNQPRKPYRPPT